GSGGGVRGVPPGGDGGQESGRYRAGPDPLSEVRGTPRRADLGQEPGRRGVDVHLHDPGALRGVRTETPMRLIGLAVVLTIGILVAPFAAGALPLSKIPRIGVLDADRSLAGNALQDGLRQLGYVEGKSIAIERRWAGGRPERCGELAAELVRLKVDVIVAANNPAVAAAQKATTAIP